MFNHTLYWCQIKIKLIHFTCPEYNVGKVNKHYVDK